MSRPKLFATWSFVVLFVAAWLGGRGCLARDFSVFPEKINLSGSDARQWVVVQRSLSGPEGRDALGSNGLGSNGLGSSAQGSGVGSQIVSDLSITIEDPNVATFEDGVVRPKSNGRTHLICRVGEQTVRVPIQVTAVEVATEWSFRNHVQAVLAKAGCNSGACHGALAGKGGFKLSLRGYNTAGDYHTITRQAQGRRIELSDPAHSLLLTKPSGAIPHKGGVRFEVDSLDYRVISQWIAAGAKGPSESDAEFHRLEIFPSDVSLKKGDKQQFVVLAHYSDGHAEDVTHWVKFTSTNETVATVNDVGAVEIVGNGVGAITAWFSQKIAIGRITAPYENKLADQIFRQAPRSSFIDEQVLGQLERLRLPSSGPCTDADFLRRAFLDTIGTLPAAQQVRDFLADENPDKRDRAVDALMARPEFVDYWAYKWSDVFLITSESLRPQAIKTFYGWIRGHVAANTPWDVFARELVTAQGSTYENGATNFFSLHQDPETMSENVSQAFLGLSINCAKCHNHPLEKWTNDQYYAMANLFARVRAKGWGGDQRSGDGLRTVYVVDRGDLVQPRTGKPQPPTPLDGESIPREATVDRRVHLAQWLTASSNPYFARSVTNRVWANFFGVGLVEPVDDMRVSNPASNELLLSSAAQYLVENRYDLRKLIRVILQSETYQRSSLPLKENQAEERFYSRYYPRRLMAEVLLDAVSQVTDVPSEFTEIVFQGADRQKTDFYPKGTRAIQLYDAAVASYFLRTFGRNQRLITCECERSDEPSMVQVLHLSNGTTLNQKLSASNNRVEKLVWGSDEGVIDEAYLSALSRYPSESEKVGLIEALRSLPEAERRIGIEDVFWSVMSSREFLFNH